MKIPRSFYFLMGALLLAPVLSDAQENSSTRALAETEVVKLSQTNPGKADHSTGALSQEQSASILKLKDEYQPPKARYFLWSFAFRASQFAGRGTMIVPGVSEQNLSDNKNSVMPAIALGTLFKVTNGSLGDWQWGVEAGFGMTAQNTTVKTAGPTVDAKINSSFMDAHTLLRWGPSEESRWHLLGGIGYGRLSMNQTSTESMVRWSKSLDYRSNVLGADFRLGDRWHVEARQRWQAANGDASEIKVPTGITEIGAKVLW